MRRVFSILLVAVMVLVLIGAANETTVFDKDEYIEQAKELAEAFNEEAVYVSNMLNFELSWATHYKQYGGRYTAEKGFENGLKLFNNKADITWEEFLEKREATIGDYKKFIRIDTSSDSFCIEIRDQMKTIFEAYNEMFHDAETPSESALTDSSKQMKTFIKTYNNLTESYF